MGADLDNGMFGDECGGESSAPFQYDAEHFLAWTNSVIRRHGWVSRTAANEDLSGRKKATADDVLYLIVPPRPITREWQEAHSENKPEEVDFAAAAAAIEWARALGDTGDELSDYYHNLRLIARAGFVRWKSAGLAASLLVAHAKAMESDVHRDRPHVIVSQHVGKVGDRMQMIVTTEKVIKKDGFYGFTGIHKMIDTAGNDLVWFASESADWLEVGEMVEVVATIKEHGEYNGRKQTTISRVKKYVRKPPKEKKSRKKKKVT
jgi:hypothetical protein